MKARPLSLERNTPSDLAPVEMARDCPPRQTVVFFDTACSWPVKMDRPNTLQQTTHRLTRKPVLPKMLSCMNGHSFRNNLARRVRVFAREITTTRHVDDRRSAQPRQPGHPCNGIRVRALRRQPRGIFWMDVHSLPDYRLLAADPTLLVLLEHVRCACFDALRHFVGCRPSLCIGPHGTNKGPHCPVGNQPFLYGLRSRQQHCFLCVSSPAIRLRVLHVSLAQQAAYGLFTETC